MEGGDTFPGPTPTHPLFQNPTNPQISPGGIPLNKTHPITHQTLPKNTQRQQKPLTKQTTCGAPPRGGGSFDIHLFAVAIHKYCVLCALLQKGNSVPAITSRISRNISNPWLLGQAEFYGEALPRERGWTHMTKSDRALGQGTSGVISARNPKKPIRHLLARAQGSDPARVVAACPGPPGHSQTTPPPTPGDGWPLPKTNRSYFF